MDTDAEEKFGLNWHGKRMARQLALTPSMGTLRPCPEESVDWDSTQNLMIEGDNLEVLKLLQKSYAGKVKLIYIDPPYNTGKDFVYPDNFQDNIKHYLELTGQTGDGGTKLFSNTEASGRFHTDWLSMIYPRLKLAHTLLSDDGVIIVSIGDEEHANLRLLLDQIFGAENFISDVVWQGGRKNDSRYVSNGADYMLVYAKYEGRLSELGVRWREPKVGLETALAKAASIWSTRQSDDDASVQWKAWLKSKKAAGEITDSVARYDQLQPGTGRPMNTYGNITWPGGGGPMYEVLHPTTHKPVSIPKRGWVYQKEEMDRRIATGQIWFGLDETAIPRGISFLDEMREQVAISVFEQDRKAANTDMRKLMGEIVFENPKDRRVLARWFRLVTRGSKNAVVLDFFGGSGSTGHAVMDLNAADGGQRRYVLVQLPEPLGASNGEQKTAAAFCDNLQRPNNIAELTKERLRRAGKQIREENPQFAGDLGFRVFKLDSSNIHTWDPDPSQAPESFLGQHIDHIKSCRIESDILYELLLKLGLDLCVPIEERTIAGKTVYAVGGGTLIACLDKSLAAGDIEALGSGIVAWHKEMAPEGDVTCVFRDSAFENDVAKTNLAAILTQNGIAIVRSL